MKETIKDKEWNEENNDLTKQELPVDVPANSGRSALQAETMGSTALHSAPTTSGTISWNPNPAIHWVAPRRSGRLERIAERLGKLWNSWASNFRR